MPRVQWRRVLIARTYPEAGLIRSQLVEAGFHAAPLAEAASVFLAGANLYYNIEVLSDEAETALRFLADVGYGDLLVRPAG